MVGGRGLAVILGLGVDQHIHDYLPGAIAVVVHLLPLAP